MGRQSRVNRSKTRERLRGCGVMCALLPSPSFPFVPCLSSSSLLWLVVSLQLHLFVSHPGIEIRPSYHYQHPGIEARRSPLWPSGLPSSGLGRWLHKTWTDSDTRDRDRDAMLMLCYPRFFPFSPRFQFALVLTFCGMFLLFPLFVSSRVL